MRVFQCVIVLLGAFAFATVLAFHNITDGDLWAKLALGASILRHGHLLRHDVFAFTPVLQRYIDHEWGAGLVFFAAIDWFGPAGLMLVKMGLAFGALAFSLGAARRQGCGWANFDITTIEGTNPSLRHLSPQAGREGLQRPVARCGWNTLFLLAIPAAACLLPGYIPTVRSHAFTFCLFAATLLCLEEMRAGRRWAAILLVLVIAAWTNLHGGFVVGLAVVFFYAAVAVYEKQHGRLVAGTALVCAAVTFLNPYGVEFWKYLIPAVLHPRARIAEWRPLPLFAADQFWGFRIFFALTAATLVLGRDQITRKRLPGLAVILLTGCLGWRSRRHGPFFAVAALAFAGPFFAAAWSKLTSRMAEPLRARGTAAGQNRTISRRFFRSAASPRFDPQLAVVAIYAALALYAAAALLPRASLQPLAPVGEDPVREADILAAAGVRGNLATPFGWGSYLAWRLFPNIKISMDGRYETTYPESTFALNNAFYDKDGDWQKLIRDYQVDFVILDLQTERLRPEDLTAHGYELVWLQDGLSALLALPEHAAALHNMASHLPPTTIDPLDVNHVNLGILQPSGPW